MDILVFRFPEKTLSTHGNTRKQTKSLMVFKEKMGREEKLQKVGTPPNPFCQPTVPRGSEDDRQDRDRISSGEASLKTPTIPLAPWVSRSHARSF